MRQAAPITRLLIAAAAAALLLIAGCVRMPSTGITALRPANFTELKTYLLDHRADVEQFRERGPFEAQVREDVDIPLPPSRHVAGDLYLSASPGRAPLVILLHGYDNSKESHAYQAYHLATWGMHSLVVDLPNHGPWVANGRMLAKIAQLIRDGTILLDPRIDTDRIVLAGHSFGASSAAIAVAEGAPALGAVLLDPAIAGKNLTSYLRKISKPVVVLGADTAVATARGRATFFRDLRGPVAEVSIKGAAHEDAEFPLEATPVVYGAESGPTEAHQVTFASALTAAAFSLASTGRFDYAWAGFTDAEKNDRFIDPRKK